MDDNPRLLRGQRLRFSWSADILRQLPGKTAWYIESVCIRIRTRGGIYGKIWSEPEGLPEGAARGQSQGLRPYFTVYPDLSPNTDIIPFLTMIY